MQELDDMRSKPPKLTKDVSDKEILKQKIKIDKQVYFNKKDKKHVAIKTKRNDFFLNSKSLINSFE